MSIRNVFVGFSLAALLGLATSPAGAVLVSGHDEVADGYIHVDPTVSTVLPATASWGSAPSTRNGNIPGIARSPFDGSDSSADAGGGAGAIDASWADYDYFAVGPGNPNNPAILDFSINQDSFTFLWGSVDTYNEITFLLNAVPIFVLTSATPGIPLPPDGGGAAFVSLTDILFDQISFFSTPSNALEFSNIVTSAIPIPPALVLFGSALVGFGYLARRRRNRTALGATA